MSPEEAATLVEVLAEHLRSCVLFDLPADSRLILNVLRDLDLFLTQKKASMVDLAVVEAYVRDLGGVASIIYLSDGGYSRLVLPAYGRLCIGLTGPPTPGVAERWNQISLLTENAKAW
jgi:hypothetical protein